MEFTAKQIAAFLQGEIVGNENATVHTFAKIEEGVPGAISFLSNPKYTPYIYDTQASIVLVNKDFVPEHEVKATLIRVDNAYDCLAFAYVGEHAVVGDRTRIYPHATVDDGARIGEDCTLYAGATVYHDCRIGNRCTLHAGSVVGADGFGFAPTPQGYEKIPQIGIAILEDDVEIGANTCVDRATMGATIIRKGVKLDNLVQIAHNDEIGAHTVMAAQAGVAGSTKVGEWCMFGGQVGVAGHIQIGDRVVFGAQSGVPGSVKSDQRLIGAPPMEEKPFFKSSAIFRKLPDMYLELNALRKELNELKKQLNKE